MDIKPIRDCEDLIVGKWYIIVSKLVYDNGVKSNKKEFTQVKNGSLGNYILNNLWAYPENNQGMEKYKIYGPIEINDILKDVEKNYPEDFLD
jgi:hypothetical protein